MSSQSQSNTEEYMSSFSSKHSSQLAAMKEGIQVKDALERELEKQTSPTMLSNSNSTSMYGGIAAVGIKKQTPRMANSGLAPDTL